MEIFFSNYDILRTTVCYHKEKRKTNVAQKPSQFHEKPISLSESKWKCHQDLKSVIEKDHRGFYDKIPFQPDKVKTKN